MANGSVIGRYLVLIVIISCLWVKYVEVDSGLFNHCEAKVKVVAWQLQPLWWKCWPSHFLGHDILKWFYKNLCYMKRCYKTPFSTPVLRPFPRSFWSLEPIFVRLCGPQSCTNRKHDEPCLCWGLNWASVMASQRTNHYAPVVCEVLVN